MNTLTGKSVGIALLMAAALIAALFAMGAFPVGAQTAAPSVMVDPATAMPGDQVTVTGNNFASAATVTITLRNRGTDAGHASETNPTHDATTGFSGSLEVTTLTNGSFVTTFLLGDGVAKGNKHLAVTGDDPRTPTVETDFEGTIDFVVEVEPTVRGFFTQDTGSAKVASINNAVQNIIFAEVHGFDTGTGADVPEAVEFTAVDSEGEEVDLGDIAAAELDTMEAERGELTINAGVLPEGDVAITATQNGTTTTAMLKVIAPTITLSPMYADNSKAVAVTVTGTNFGPGAAATAVTFYDDTAADPTATELAITVTTKNDDDEDVAVEIVDPVAADFSEVGLTGFTQKITLPIGTDPGDLTIKATVNHEAVTASQTSQAIATGDYADMASFTLNPATPAQVMSVELTPGEGELLATWQEVTAVNRTDDNGVTVEMRPAATEYKVEWKLATAATWDADDSEMVTGGGQTAHLVTGLTPSQLYMVRVSAKATDTAYGMSSSVAVGTPLAITPDAPAPPDERPALGAMLMATDSDTPGAGVRVELALHAKERLDLDDKIVVDFSSFGLPDSIDESRVDVRVWGRDGNDGEARMPYEGNPSDVTISGSEVTLVLETLENSNASPKTVSRLMMDDEVEITFRESAGITNPTAAGDYSISIDADRTKGRTADPDNAGEYLDRNNASVVRKVSVDPKKGSSGSEITVTGKGFGAGTATVFLDDGDGMFEDSDTILMRNVSIDKGSFEVTLTVGDSFDAGNNTINAIDGAGNEADNANAATFTVTSNITASPSEAALSEEVTIKVDDWGKGQVTSINFGGIEVTNLTGNTTGTAAKGQFKFTVPGTARIGVNKVTLKVGDESEGSVNVTVKALPLDVSPSSVVPGQQVTITGSDFAELETGETITITIGGKSARVPGDADVTSTGRVAVTTTVPLDVGDGEAKVVLSAGSMKGEGMVTVAEPSITVSPETSAPGTVIGVAGSGFASSARIEVFYGGAIEEVGMPTAVAASTCGWMCRPRSLSTTLRLTTLVGPTRWKSRSAMRRPSRPATITRLPVRV